jgi:hypothetical protein
MKIHHKQIPLSKKEQFIKNKDNSRENINTIITVYGIRECQPTKAEFIFDGVLDVQEGKTKSEISEGKSILLRTRRDGKRIQANNSNILGKTATGLAGSFLITGSYSVNAQPKLRFTQLSLALMTSE